MIARSPLISATFLLGLVSLAQAQTTQPAVEELPLDVMQRLYAPLCVPGDPLSWPMKVDAASASALKFSTSARELYFRWAKTACADWSADFGGYVPSHGDVHFGNLGSYVSDLQSARLSLGLKDFDETASMPFQSDLLQAMVTLRLTTASGGLNLSPAQVNELAAELLAAYRSTADSGQTATEALGDDAQMGKLLEPGKKTLRAAVDQWIEGGRFKRVIVNNKGEVRDLFRPALKDNSPEGTLEKSVLAGAMARAVAVSPRLARVATYTTTTQWEGAIEDAVLRTRPGSGGSQGMVKLMVHVRAGVKTLGGGTSDAIFYFKQQGTASAGQRAGFVPTTDLPGGRRVSGGAAVLTSPEVDAVGWCDLFVAGAERSFFVTVRDPWEDEPGEKLDTSEKALWAARVFGTVLGAAHRSAAGTPESTRQLTSRVSSVLRQQLIDRSAAWVEENARQYQLWISDDRVKALLQEAQVAWKAATTASTTP